jgi:hypothetical protein
VGGPAGCRLGQKKTVSSHAKAVRESTDMLMESKELGEGLNHRFIAGGNPVKICQGYH